MQKTWNDPMSVFLSVAYPQATDAHGHPSGPWGEYTSSTLHPPVDKA